MRGVSLLSIAVSITKGNSGNKVNKEMKRFSLLLILLVLCGMAFIACQWQLEVADNFLLNGWGAYKVLFNWIVIEDVWAVRDFWMLMLDISFVAGLALMFMIGRKWRTEK